MAPSVGAPLASRDKQKRYASSDAGPMYRSQGLYRGRYLEPRSTSCYQHAVTSPASSLSAVVRIGGAFAPLGPGLVTQSQFRALLHRLQSMVCIVKNSRYWAIANKYRTFSQHNCDASQRASRIRRHHYRHEQLLQTEQRGNCGTRAPTLPACRIETQQWTV